ncbi:hypothetical protein [Caenimonas koreensis]|uniref:Uncharacterized protein n=1 Tax=Caenimonas koreensis DSM 17982 TaxID=1121255 RepID=A0A844B9T1_9BURK|nr:hypothetical protein [Caenimonas koreensis]MRD48237.1 hypothetical protein [Caenimonas koreensis DSM 17982]
MEKFDYKLKIWEAEATDLDLAAAEERFRKSMEEHLGAPALVLAVYESHRRLSCIYGYDPDMEDLSDAERHIFVQWQDAERHALAAAFGPNRYMGDAMYEISDPEESLEMKR